MNEPTYAAVIQITLPGSENSVTANITLTPVDSVPVGGRVKPLRDCTLADLRRYAETLEDEVWQTYQDIKLIELVAEDVRVEVLVNNRAGEPLPPLKNWTQHAVLLPQEELEREVETESELEAEAQTETETETQAAELSEIEAGEAGVNGAEPAGYELLADEAAVTPVADVPEEEDVFTEFTLHVAEPEPVHPEREAPLDMASPAAVATPDIAPSQARVRIAGRRRPLGDPTWAAVDILVEEPALRSAQAHALSSLDREVAGVLIGPRPEKQPDGRYVVHVFDTILAKYTVMQGASVTYTPESWRYMNDRLAERYPDESAVMVGWYHTHPGFGIFLSGMDLFIHQNFFTQIWHVALVLDPRARKSGFFCWNRHKTSVDRYDFPWPAWAEGSW